MLRHVGYLIPTADCPGKVSIEALDSGDVRQPLSHYIAIRFRYGGLQTRRMLP